MKRRLLPLLLLLPLAACSNSATPITAQQQQAEDAFVQVWRQELPAASRVELLKLGTEFCDYLRVIDADEAYFDHNAVEMNLDSNSMRWMPKGFKLVSETICPEWGPKVAAWKRFS